MPNGPIRRSQLIAPFGVGSLYVDREGVSLISAGLDHWFEREDMSGGIIEDEFKISEWRLQRALAVSHFMMPADFRRVSNLQSSSIPNAYLQQPFLRFPRWHYCQHQKCHLLAERPLVEQNRIFCTSSKHEGRKRPPMHQVPFVAICPKGHIQDFPWREYVHRNPLPHCNLPLQLINRGSANLGSEWVKCECGEERPLSNILGHDTDSGAGRLSALTTANNSGTSDEPPYLCKGHRPWLGSSEPSDCSESLTGALRGASNVYFAHTRSSIYLPRSTGTVGSELVGLIEDPMILSAIQNVTDTGGIPNARFLQGIDALRFINYTEEQINEALEIVSGSGSPTPSDPPPDEDDPQLFLRQEYQVLREAQQEQDLEIRSEDLASYEDWVSDYFGKIMLVSKLRETRALIGFSRVFEETQHTLPEMKQMLRKTPPSSWRDNWLPAYVVYGEGIYLELKESIISTWEQDPYVQERLKPLVDRYFQSQADRRAEARPASARFALLHTFAHIIINSLTFECGYSTAALRERLYVSDDPESPMAGLLIYTASGDADGTMGGLVRMGKPGFLEPVITNALEEARWCSADPICMEVGAAAGQGPDSCNLAACHNCALVPETSCEVFNKLLDRATLVGGLGGSPEGFFRV